MTRFVFLLILVFAFLSCAGVEYQSKSIYSLRSIEVRDSFDVWTGLAIDAVCVKTKAGGRYCGSYIDEVLPGTSSGAMPAEHAVNALGEPDAECTSTLTETSFKTGTNGSVSVGFDSIVDLREGDSVEVYVVASETNSLCNPYSYDVYIKTDDGQRLFLYTDDVASVYEIPRH